ncbi:MAG: HD domain-containing protein [Candidatus Aegiribacteria sp.]|nr:HD domain-containing protein [Candidatus Aegiribacteria sp.]
MKNRIEALFKEQLDKISDPELRRKTVEIWTAAAEEGGWEPVDLEKIPFTLLTDTHGINLIQHTIAVTEGALGLARAIQSNCTLPFLIDHDILVAGGLLHDVGKLLEIERTEDGYVKSLHGKHARHPISGAILAARFDMPMAIINMIGCHAKEGEGRPQRVETVLVHQADFATFNPMMMLQKGLLIT